MPGPAHGPSGNDNVAVETTAVFCLCFSGKGIADGIIGGGFRDCSICLARLGW
jgi:hypothetical protein